MKKFNLKQIEKQFGLPVRLVAYLIRKNIITPIVEEQKLFITEAMKNAEIDEFLQKKLERAGYGGVNLSKTPLGTHVVVYAMRPGLVIGRGGETIRELAAVLEQNFKVANPQISVSEIEVPELNAYVVASRVTSALQKGIHFRRAGFWALNQVMEAGALGCEIVISGKLRTERARFEKFRAGYFPRCGEPALKYTRKTEAHVPHRGDPGKHLGRRFYG